MKSKLTALAIDQLPIDAHGEFRLVTHYFYGKESKLRKARAKIKDFERNAIFDFKEGCLLVAYNLKLNQEALNSAVKKMEAISNDCSIEYDGYELALEDVIDSGKTFDSFSSAYQRNVYLKFRLSNGKIGYVLFVGGNDKDGLFFDCIASVDDGCLKERELDKMPRLYKQPVQGYFDPNIFELVGPSGLPLRNSIKFRVAYGDYPSHEEMDNLATKYGFQAPLKDEDFFPFLFELSKKKVKICSRDYHELIFELGLNGKVKSKQGGLISKNSIDLPMLFGSFARYENLDKALTGGYDELLLLDLTS